MNAGAFYYRPQKAGYRYDYEWRRGVPKIPGQALKEFRHDRKDYKKQRKAVSKFFKKNEIDLPEAKSAQVALYTKACEITAKYGETGIAYAWGDRQQNREVVAIWTLGFALCSTIIPIVNVDGRLVLEKAHKMPVKNNRSENARKAESMIPLGIVITAAFTYMYLRHRFDKIYDFVEGKIFGSMDYKLWGKSKIDSVPNTRNAFDEKMKTIGVSDGKALSGAYEKLNSPKNEREIMFNADGKYHSITKSGGNLVFSELRTTPKISKEPVNKMLVEMEAIAVAVFESLGLIKKES